VLFSIFICQPLYICLRRGNPRLHSVLMSSQSSTSTVGDNTGRLPEICFQPVTMPLNLLASVVFGTPHAQANCRKPVFPDLNSAIADYIRLSSHVLIFRRFHADRCLCTFCDGVSFFGAARRCVADLETQSFLFASVLAIFLQHKSFAHTVTNIIYNIATCIAITELRKVEWGSRDSVPLSQNSSVPVNLKMFGKVGQCQVCFR